MRHPRISPGLAFCLTALAVVPSLLSACSGSHSTDASNSRVVGQTEYASAPLPGSGGRNASFGGAAGNAGASNGSSSSSGGSAPTSGSTSTAPVRQVQETDIYRVDGNRLYYLNSYRGLMVFDVTNVDHPALLGRSPIFGDPQEMIVNSGIAVVVVGDWYGTTNGRPFHGSIARGLDCTDPTNIKNVGDAYLGGWVQDTRVVGTVLYTVAEDYGWTYGWAGPGAVVSSGTTAQGPSVSVASVNFAGGTVAKVGEQTFAGTGGVFNVTPNAIMLASQHVTDPSQPYNGPSLTDLRYIDISDPNGAIAPRGAITIGGSVSGWGPDNGRWNLDFADNVHAHTIGCANQYCGGGNDAYALTTADFSNPDAPTVASTLSIAGLGWSAAARFDVDPAGTYAHMYLSPADAYSQPSGQTPLSIYDLSKPQAPVLAGSTNLDGNIWLFIPQGSKLFALGSSYDATNDPSQVEVQYVDVGNPAAPARLGTTQFGSGWAWSPAADTFKAFVVNAAQGLAVVPFSGWDGNDGQYANGVQLIGFTNTGLTTSGTARTRGWVERGIFVKNRLVSLSDQALAVIDYTNPSAPVVVTEMTLARNVVSAVPQGSTIAELSSDWYGNDISTSEMRVLPIANAAETSDSSQAATASIRGVDAQVFENGTLSYVVTDVQAPAPCGTTGPTYPSGKNGGCYAYTQQVQVVDTSNGGATLRGSVTLPILPPSYYGGYGWGGYYYYDWYNGANVVQVGKDALALRRWYPQYDYNGGAPIYSDEADALYVVDLKNADKPAVASLTITRDTTAWWGSMMAVGNTLYTSHYAWTDPVAASDAATPEYSVRYYLDQIDLSDRAHPRVGRSVNVPGTLVGASSQDPSLLYFADYRWINANETDEIAVCKLSGSVCELQSVTALDGYVGNVIVQNDKAYMTVQQYEWAAVNGTGAYTPPFTELHQLDLSNPTAPRDRVTTDRHDGWGWLLGVAGDRAIVTSGWGPVAVDIYQLSDTAAPAFEQSVRALGWGENAVTRQGNTLYLVSGYWGVQPVVLQ